MVHDGIPHPGFPRWAAGTAADVLPSVRVVGLVAGTALVVGLALARLRREEEGSEAKWRATRLGVRS